MEWFIEGLGCLLWGCKKKSRSLVTGVVSEQERLRAELVTATLEQAAKEGDTDPVKTWKVFAKDIEQRLKDAS